jgi:hypothetical protein
MDITHKYIVIDVSNSYNKRLAISLKLIDDAYNIGPSYCPRWRDKLVVEPVMDNLKKIRESVENNAYYTQIDHKEFTLPNPTFEIVTASEEIDFLVESAATLEERFQDELNAKLALKRKHFEEFSKLLDFEKLSIYDIQKLQKAITD